MPFFCYKYHDTIIFTQAFVALRLMQKTNCGKCIFNIFWKDYSGFQGL